MTRLTQTRRWATLAAFSVLSLNAFAAATNGTELAFSRIIHGWTNYSTGFNATHDTNPEVGDFATVASFYTPDKHVRPREYGVIVIWLGDHPQRLDFANFDFQFHIWSSLAALTNSPRTGDVATVTFTAPTGGSTTTGDATTRGGRSAYYLTFRLTNSPVALTAGHTYLVGFGARTDTTQNGELYVPTAPTSGPSDVQAGDLVRDGWQYITNLGGLTIYSGQLATEMFVEPLPQLRIRPAGTTVEVAWPSTLNGFTLESASTPAPESTWLTVFRPLTTNAGWTRVNFPDSATAQFFRLRKNQPPAP